MKDIVYRIRHRRFTRFAAPIAVALAVLIPATSAHAEWYFTQRGAQIMAKDYVSKHYTDTYEENLTAECRPQGRRASDQRYKYHRWVCTWVDHSDKTYGQVLIVGRSLAGGYYGSVLHGARYL